jgi:RimJ/RimL family protein N-acetyltransferase
MLLRPYRIDDYEAMYGLMSAPEAQLHPRRPPLGPEESWTRLLRHVGHWAEFGYGFFAVEDRATGAFVGEAGFSFFRRGLGSRYEDAPEATWTIAAERRGAGLATEAAAAALAWADEQIRLPRTLCMIHAANRPSLRVAEKLGYREFGRVAHQGHPAVYFERERRGRGPLTPPPPQAA